MFLNHAIEHFSKFWAVWWCQTNLWLNEIYAYLRLWNSIHDLCKTNDNCILGVVSISKGMVSIFLLVFLEHSGNSEMCWFDANLWCHPTKTFSNFFFLKKVVKYLLIKDSAFKRIFISVKTPTVRNFSWYQTHVHLPSVCSLKIQLSVSPPTQSKKLFSYIRFQYYKKNDQIPYWGQNLDFILGSNNQIPYWNLIICFNLKNVLP